MPAVLRSANLLGYLKKVLLQKPKQERQSDLHWPTGEFCCWMKSTSCRKGYRARKNKRRSGGRRVSRGPGLVITGQDLPLRALYYPDIIRELKKIVEQISVPPQEGMIQAKELLVARRPLNQTSFSRGLSTASQPGGYEKTMSCRSPHPLLRQSNRNDPTNR